VPLLQSVINCTVLDTARREDWRHDRKGPPPKKSFVPCLHRELLHTKEGGKGPEHRGNYNVR